MDDKEKNTMNSAVDALLNFHNLNIEEMNWCLDNSNILEYLFGLTVTDHSGVMIINKDTQWWSYQLNHATLKWKCMRISK